ncbi:unnamed protein product, partial [marine sediment metagenome]
MQGGDGRHLPTILGGLGVITDEDQAISQTVGDI